MSGEWQHQDPTVHRVQPLNPEPGDLELSREAIVLKVHSATTFQKSTFQTTHAIPLLDPIRGRDSDKPTAQITEVSGFSSWQRQRLFSSPQCLNRLWGPPSCGNPKLPIHLASECMELHPSHTTAWPAARLSTEANLPLAI